MRTAQVAGLVVALGLVLAGCEPAATDRGTRAESVAAGATASPAPSSTPSPETWTTAPSPVPTAPPPRLSAAPKLVVVALLHAAAGGDGDSWKDTSGREYRMGLVNTPEYDECFGAQATAKRKQLVAGGFRAQTYTTDRYGRLVSVISLPDGTNLNVWMARNGYADDKYLAAFRSENPALATRLDAAFAAAKQARLGLWGACSGATAAPAPSAAPQPAAGASCHPDYRTCIPVKGDGSGNGAANDLDCGDIRELVRLRQVGVDPYRLDADGDGYGCDSYA